MTIKVKFFTFKTFINLIIEYSQNMVTPKLCPSEIEQVKQNHKPTKVVGCAGTLLLMDTSTIHSGAPILIGSRYALTNRYYSRN